MAKEIKFEADARSGMAEGVKKLADAVKAVSYTHLDVYKRQVWIPSNTHYGSGFCPTGFCKQ